MRIRPVSTDPRLEVYSHNLLLERVQRALVDGIAVFLAVLLAVWIRHSSGWISESITAPWSIYLFPAVAIALVTVFVLFFAGSYVEPGRVAPSPVLIAALGASTLIALTVSFFYREESYSRVTVIIFVPIAVVVVTAMRFAYDRYVRTVWQAEAVTRNVLIVGRTTSGLKLAAALTREPAYYNFLGFLDDSMRTDGSGSGQDVLAQVSALGEVIDELNVDEVMICLLDDSDRVLDAIGECMRRNVTWRAVPNMYGLRLERVSVENFGGVPLVGSHGTQLVGFNRTQKRGFDVLVASVAMILLAPVLLVVAVAVRLTSRGRVLFRQTRVGLDGETFTMLKFRSMRIGNSSDSHNKYALQWIYGRTGSDAQPSNEGEDKARVDPPQIHKMTSDPRITSVGKVLRAASLDELPQLWNVLRGDMSIVGPRPALPYEVDRYTEWHRRRLAVPPGITGAWQVSGRNELPFEEMVRLDVDYIERWSFHRDLALLFLTIPAVLKLGGK